MVDRKQRKRRVPKLKYTEVQNIGWHVSYRDPVTKSPRRYRFGMVPEQDAQQLYHAWVAEYLKGSPPIQSRKTHIPKRTGSIRESSPVVTDMTRGSLLDITTGLLKYEESRIRPIDEERRQGTISRTLYNDRKHYTKEFLAYLNGRYGSGAVKRMTVPDITMEDIEEYNRSLVKAGLSASQVTKRLRFVKTIVNRAGRPEYGNQALAWNWAALDVLHGKAPIPRQLPTLKQLKLILQNCGTREAAIVWIAIGCGFGQRDIAAIRLNNFDRTNYDLRRGKTGMERYGETPKMVWLSISKYLKTVERKSNDLMFVTRMGNPIVHGNSDSIVQWWTDLRARLGDACKDLDGFYILRHLGATVFGARPGCSISSMKRWLGHSASSQIADVYMKPVSPEYRPIVEWVSSSLASGKSNLKISKND